MNIANSGNLVLDNSAGQNDWTVNRLVQSDGTALIKSGTSARDEVRLDNIELRRGYIDIAGEDSIVGSAKDGTGAAASIDIAGGTLNMASGKIASGNITNAGTLNIGQAAAANADSGSHEVLLAAGP